MALERSPLDPAGDRLWRAGDHRPRRAESERRTPDLVAMAWRWLLLPRLLLSTALAILVLVAAALILPQLPGQLNDEPAAAARWLLATGSAYGALGDAARGLGLFNVLHSLLFRALLSFLSLLLALHFVDSLGTALSIRTLIARLHTFGASASEPVPLPAHQAVYRTRRAVDVGPPSVTAGITAAMGDLYGYTVQAGACAGSEDEETRLLGLRRRLSYALQTLPPLGLLIILGVVWLFLLAGWDISSPTLAPGEAYRAPAHNLLVQYLVADAAAPSPDAVAVSLQIDGEEIAASAAAGARIQSGGVELSVRQEEAGLLVRSVASLPLLALPGQTDPTAGVGLILPSPGSEESILLPDLAAGLRVVRPADGTRSFLIEVYRGQDLEPEQRITVAGPLQHEINGNDPTTLLEFVPLPGLRVSVRHMPGLWLIWPGAGLILLGAVGYVWRPAFALIQIAPWPPDRSVVVTQSSHMNDMDRLINAAGSAQRHEPA